MRNFGFEERQEPVRARRPAPRRAHRPPHSPPHCQIATSPCSGPTLRFKGELSADEDFILQGRLEGSINHTQSVTIGTEGVVQGNIHARVVVVDGLGRRRPARQRVRRRQCDRAASPATFSLRASALVDGALFNGRIDMGARQATAARPPTVPAQPGVLLSVEQTERILGSK